MDPKKQGRKTASDRVFQAISDEIIKGRLEPGQKISEPELAKRYGTSRAPVREAIRRLVERGLITHEPHRGPRVASFSTEKYIEIFEIREALEGIACRLASERMTEGELFQLRDIVQRHEKELRDHPGPGYAYQYQDIDFHFLIAKGSKNSFIIRLLCEDYYNMLLIQRKLHSWIPGRGKQALKEHFRILEAVEERDGELAEILMRRHINAAKLKVVQAYERLIADGKIPTPGPSASGVLEPHKKT